MALQDFQPELSAIQLGLLIRAYKMPILAY